MEKQSVPTNYGALSTLTTVFFFWGFIAAGNSIFIPFCKHYFDLDQFQSQLIDFAFYMAYYVGALGLFIAGSSKGKDIVGSWGYKKSIVYGLLFSALGAVAMIVSVYLNVFAGMLFGLFIVALGFSLQQTSANPFMIALGDEATGSNRISLGGGINSFGTFIGPIIVSLALFGSAAAVEDDMIESLSLTKVILLYAGVGCLFLGVAALFGFSKKVPDGKTVETNTGETLKAKKAVATLLIITGLLFACFAPVFSSYRTAEAREMSALEKQVKAITKKEDAFKKEHAKHELKLKKESASTSVLENEKATYKRTIWTFKLQKDPLKDQIETIRKPLDRYRMIWLTGGLIVILGGLLFASVKGSRGKVGWGAMQYPQLTLGMLAIFVYVGVEVAIGSNLGELLKQPQFGGYSSSEITPFVSMFWGSLMIGRWTDSVNAFQMKPQTRLLLQLVIPFIAFGIILGVFTISGYDVKPLYWYILCIVIQVLAYYLTKNRPVITLTVFGTLGVAAMVIGLTTTGMTAVYSILSGGLFCSIMWSCIFSLSLAGLGKYQAQGSAFLVMMILGGAIIPPLQGKLSDIIGIQASFVVGAVCFAYITFFAVYVNNLLKKRGVVLEAGASH